MQACFSTAKIYGAEYLDTKSLMNSFLCKTSMKVMRETKFSLLAFAFSFFSIFNFLYRLIYIKHLNIYF